MRNQTHGRAALVAVLSLVLAAVVGGSATANGGGGGSATGDVKPDGTPKTTTVGGVAPQFLANADTIPHWTFQYTDPSNGATYPITMVGADPKTNADTSVHAVIVPLKINFVAGNQDTSSLDNLGFAGFHATPLTHTFDGGRRAGDLVSSPIFANATTPGVMGGDTAQYGDAFMRAQFNKIGTSYHVRLVSDGALPTQTIDVPASKGVAFQRPVGAWRTANGMPTETIGGFADANWFSERLQNLLSSLKIPGHVVPIFLTDNVLLYQGTYGNCCIIGYHGAGMPIGNGAGSANGKGKQPVNTFIYGAWTTPGTYSGFLSDYSGVRTAPSPTRGLADIHAISHEVAEWLDDPFVNNAVKPWVTPTAPQYGCTPVLETGDPVVGVWFPYSGNNAGTADGYNYYGQYHPEDEVNAQWFGHGGVEAAGYSSFNGNLTFMGPLTTGIPLPGYADFGSYSKGC